MQDFKSRVLTPGNSIHRGAGGLDDPGPFVNFNADVVCELFTPATDGHESVLGMRPFMSALCMMRSITVFNWPSMSVGVPAGASTPYHWLDS